MRTKTGWAGRKGVARLGIGLLALALVGAQAQPPAIPDAPRPHVDLPTDGVTPGSGTTANSTSSSGTDVSTPSAPEPQTNPPTAPATGAQPAPQTGAPGGQQTVVAPSGEQNVTAREQAIQTLIIRVNEVNIPFTVKDSKGRLVPGIRPSEVQVFENGRLQHIDVFTDDFLPMSVAIVIDQGMTRDQMDRVNTALGALQDAFSKYDEVSIFTYNKSDAKEVTEFTGAQSSRATQAIEISKSSGRDALLPGSLEGPAAQNIVINDQNFDPNTSANRGRVGMAINVPREVHPLNDAILTAAVALSKQPVGRRRVIYVISNGNEYGSKAKYGQVLKILQTNSIEVDGTLVGDSSLPLVGMLDRVHLPLMMRDNVLTPYANATSGNVDAEFRIAAIEKSFARVASEARNRYTVTYRTHEDFVDGKWRTLNLTILRPGLTVLAPSGYWPAAQERLQQRPPTSGATGSPVTR